MGTYYHQKYERIKQNLPPTIRKMTMISIALFQKLNLNVPKESRARPIIYSKLEKLYRTKLIFLLKSGITVTNPKKRYK